MLMDFHILKHPCIPGMKPTWSGWMIVLMCHSQLPDIGRPHVGKPTDRSGPRTGGYPVANGLAEL